MAADLIADLAAATLASSAAILLMLLLRTPLRRAAGSRLVYAAWLLVPLSAVVVFLPSPPAWLSLFAPEPVAAAGFNVIAAGATEPTFDWRPAAVAVWLAGAAVGLLTVALLQRRALARLDRQAAPGPAVVGVILPRIVLPADFERRYSPEEQRVILSHEEVHLALGDVRVNAAVALFACLFWFNPLVHLAARLVRADQELSCDEAVIARHPSARRTYAEALLKTQLSSSSMPLGCYWPERSHKALKERLNMLTLKHPGRGRRIAGAALLCALGLGTGYVAWAAAPQDARPLDPSRIDEKVDTLEVIQQSPLLPDGRVLVRTSPEGAPVAMTIEEHEAYLKARYGGQAAAPAPALTNSRIGARHKQGGGEAAAGDGFVVIPSAEPLTPEARAAAQRARESLEAAIRDGAVKGVSNVVQRPDGTITFTAKSVSREVALASLRGESVEFEAFPGAPEGPTFEAIGPRR